MALHWYLAVVLPDKEKWMKAYLEYCAYSSRPGRPTIHPEPERLHDNEMRQLEADWLEAIEKIGRADDGPEAAPAQ